MRELTARQLDVLRFISDFRDAYGYPPTMREIGRHAGIKSCNGVNDHLHRLEQKFCIVREQTKSRGIAVTELGHAKLGMLPTASPPSPPNGTVSIPLHREIVAGQPMPAPVAFINVSRKMVGTGSLRDVFAFTMTGDSLASAGILSGDHVLIRRQLGADRHDLVAAFLGEGLLLRYYHPDKDFTCFRAANSKIPHIYVRPDDMRRPIIFGVAIGLWRDVRGNAH